MRFQARNGRTHDVKEQNINHETDYELPATRCLESAIEPFQQRSDNSPWFKGRRKTNDASKI